MKSLNTTIETKDGAVDLRPALMQLLASDGSRMLHSVDKCHKLQDLFQQMMIITVRSKNLYDLI